MTIDIVLILYLYTNQAVMDLATRKLQLLEQFMKIASTEKIEKLEQFFKKEISNDPDVYDEMPEIIQKIVEKSLKESESGKVVSSSDVMAKIKVKYNAI